MAEALCGPSNPLQSFQKHASADRTLQRDRLQLRKSPVEGFRTPHANAAVVDAEFEAFLAGEPVLGPFDPPHAWQHQHPPAIQPGLQHPKAPDWALDFQNLHVDEARATPLHSTQFRQQAPMQRSLPGTWQQEFQQKNQPQGFHQQSSRLDYAKTGFLTNGGRLGTFDQQNDIFANQQQPEIQEEGSFDEEAFEKAFNQATQDFKEDNVDRSLPKEVEGVSEARIDYRIGSDRILDESLRNQDGTSEAREADELAKTAGQLLENVKHDQSSKFQESNFLSLMRQLRDKEVKVENEKIVNVSAESRYIPHGSLSAKDASSNFDFTSEEIEMMKQHGLEKYANADDEGQHRLYCEAQDELKRLNLIIRELGG